MSNVLLLGATSDMAVALAHEYAKRGDTLILAGRHASALEPIAKDLAIRHTAAAHAVVFDVLDQASHAAFYAALPVKPDIAICVAGYLGDAEKARHDLDESKRILETNFNGPASILRVVADDFEKRGAGVIVGIGSVAGDRGRQSNYVYGSAKAGFHAFLSGLRNRFAKKGVHVLTVKPGFCRTKMTEGLKLPPLVTATPQQVARDIIHAIEKKRDVLYTLWMWRWIMLLIRNIPEGIFKKLGM